MSKPEAAPVSKPWFALKDVYQHLGYNSNQSALNAVNLGTFPIPTFKIGKFRAIHVDVYNACFKKHRDDAILELMGL